MTTPRYFDPEADRLFAQMESARRRMDGYRLSATAAQAQAIGQMARAYPQLRPGAAYSLGSAQLPPEDPAARAAVLADRQRSNKGLLDHIGTVMSGAVKGVQKVADEAIYDPLKGVSRAAFAATSMVGELAQEGVRELLNPAQDFTFDSTMAGAGLQEILRDGFKADYGSGFFPGGKVAERQKRAAREGGLINGRAITAGRASARGVGLSPGSIGYNVMSGIVDAAVSLAGDPSSYAAPIVKAVHAGRLLNGPEVVASREAVETAAGLVRGETRNTVLPQKAHDWLLKSGQGQRVMDELVNSRAEDFERVRQLFKNKIPAATLAKIVRSEDREEILALLADDIGNAKIMERFGVNSANATLDRMDFLDVGMRIKARPRDSRLWALMPGAKIDFDESHLDSSVEELNRWQQNGGLDEADRSRNNLALIEASSPEERYKAVMDTVGQVTVKVEESLFKAHLKKANKTYVDPAEAEKQARRSAKNAALGLTRVFDDMVSDAKYLVDDLARNAELPSGAQRTNQVVTGGEIQTLTDDHHLWLEGLQRDFRLPDARAIRDALENPRLRALLHEGAVGSKVDRLSALADSFRELIWVPAKLLRGAYMVRNLMEAQLSMSAGGFASAIVRPHHFIGWVVGSKGSYEEQLAQMAQEAAEAGLRLSKRETRSLRRKKAVAGAAERVGIQTGRGRIDALGQDYQRLSEEARVMDWWARSQEQRGFAMFRTADGKRVLHSREFRTYTKGKDDKSFTRAWAYRMSMLANDPVTKRVLKGEDLGERASDWFWSGAGKKFREGMTARDPRLATREGADAYIAWLDSATKQITGSHPALIRMLQTGRVDGIKMWNGDDLNRKVYDQLERYLDNAPDELSAPHMLAVKDSQAAELVDGMKAWTGRMFQALGSVPENKLSRAPVFRQAYWNRMADMAERLDADSTAQMLDAARASHVDGKLMKRLQEAGARRNGSLSLEGADEVAKRYALDQVHKWLYTATDKAQFFDITRNLFVFGDAWRDISKRWVRIGVTKPHVPVRAMHALNAGREADPGEDGRGIFYPDPTTGEERFAWPGVGGVLKALTGVDVEFEGSLRGMNIVTQSVIPGIGPATSLPASWFIPDDPEWDAIRNAVLPYGKQDGLGVMPPFIDKALTAFSGRGNSQKRAEAYAATQMDVMTHLFSTGKYDLSKPEDAVALLEDAKAKTRPLFVLRAVAQFVLPTAPIPSIKAQIKDDKTAAIAVLATRLRKLQEEDFETATLRFLEEFGDSAMLVLGSKTRSESNVEPTAEAGRFARKYAREADQFPKVYGLFVGPGGSFDFEAYQQQRARGDRVLNSPDEFLAQAEQRVASAIYRQAKEQVGPNPRAGGKEYLRQVRELLVQDFTKYNPQRYDPGKVSDEIRQLAEAVNSKLGDTEAGQGLRLYLEARDKVVAAASEMGVTGWQRAQATSGLRAYLRDVAEAISSEFPDFAYMWERSLRREMPSAEEAIAA